jgi:ElaB/YqjD/DUF883 family membrane-anchored ribosome-binding protein
MAAERELNAEMEKLKAELEKMRSDFAGLAGALKGAGAAGAEEVKDSAAHMAASVKEQIVHALHEAREKGKASVEAVEKQVGEHPLVSLLAAFGAGFLVAKLLDRK